MPDTRSSLQRSICPVIMISNMLHPGLERTTCRKWHCLTLKPFSTHGQVLSHSSVSICGTEAAEWDKNTWTRLEDLARNHPEAGVHFQGIVYSKSHRLLLDLLTRLQNARYIIALKTLIPQRQPGSLNYYPRIRGLRTLYQM